MFDIRFSQVVQVYFSAIISCFCITLYWKLPPLFCTLAHNAFDYNATTNYSLRYDWSRLGTVNKNYKPWASLREDCCVAQQNYFKLNLRCSVSASCGSCYSFATMGMLEARVRILTNNSETPILSPQQVVSCSEYSQGKLNSEAILLWINDLNE